MIWTPHLTVAAIIEQQGHFLMVEEAADGRKVLNQPAGHVEEHESITQAVIRETREEAGVHFTPQWITGIYRWANPDTHITYLRICFCGPALEIEPKPVLDKAIEATHWLSHVQLQQRAGQTRSPLVLKCVADYLQGQRYPLNLLCELAANKI